MKLSKKDTKLMLKTLKNPPKPNKVLKSLFEQPIKKPKVETIESLRETLEKTIKKSKARRNSLKCLQRAYNMQQKHLREYMDTCLNLKQSIRNYQDILAEKEIPWWKKW
jgi:transcription elongation factor GreA-like protein